MFYFNFDFRFLGFAVIIILRVYQHLNLFSVGKSGVFYVGFAAFRQDKPDFM